MPSTAAMPARDDPEAFPGARAAQLCEPSSEPNAGRVCNVLRIRHTQHKGRAATDRGDSRPGKGLGDPWNPRPSGAGDCGVG